MPENSVGSHQALTQLKQSHRSFSQALNFFLTVHLCKGAKGNGKYVGQVGQVLATAYIPPPVTDMN